MTTDETDKMVAATLAAAKASAAKHETHAAYVAEYEAILAVLKDHKRTADARSNARA